MTVEHNILLEKFTASYVDYLLDLVWWCWNYRL